jgi:branched-subunit amino acid transport protein
MKNRDMTLVALVLVALSGLLYLVHGLVFRDPRHLADWLLNSLAFLPLQVLFVTFVVDRLLADRERRARRYHMNMVIGTFFSSAGNDLLRRLRGFMPCDEEICSRLAAGLKWSDEDFRRAGTYAAEVKLPIAVSAAGLTDLRDVLAGQRDFLLRLLENPTLLEHEAFTDLLWAVCHVAEELAARERLDDLPASDLEHLTGDVARAYSALVKQWLQYLLHLRANYPYLFSFAVRTNPLIPDARPEVV